MKTIHPTNYLDGITNIPTSPDDFIGGARDAAIAMQKTILRSIERDHAPIKLMYAGNAGVGKTALTYYARYLMKLGRYAVHEYNGTQLNIDSVKDMGYEIHMTISGLFGDYRLYVINESNHMSTQAQAGLLSVLDRLPSRTAVICTTNIAISNGDKVEKERFTSRFKYTEITPPNDADLAQFLNLKFAIPTNIACQIAASTHGNVRAALLEAEEWMDSNHENKIIDEQPKAV